MAQYSSAYNGGPGASGMKAALNGVPGLSVLDRWWIEGHIDVMRNAIAINGSFFNTYRRRQEYVLKAYFR